MSDGLFGDALKKIQDFTLASDASKKLVEDDTVLTTFAHQGKEAAQKLVAKWSRKEEMLQKNWLRVKNGDMLIPHLFASANSQDAKKKSPQKGDMLRTALHILNEATRNKGWLARGGDFFLAPSLQTSLQNSTRASFQQIGRAVV